MLFLLLTLVQEVGSLFPYSGFYMDLCLPNFIVIGRTAAELWRHIDFLRWWT